MASLLSGLLLSACNSTSVSPIPSGPSKSQGSPAAAGGPSASSAAASSGAPRESTPAGVLARLRPLTAPFLAPGSQPAALPGPVIVADRDNNRLVILDPRGRTLWQFPRPGDLASGQTFLRPDDVFFSPDGTQIVATQEDDQVVSVIDIATRHIVNRYGAPGHAGSTVGRLSNPDDAMLLPDGRLLIADIRNCRVLLIRQVRQVHQVHQGAPRPSTQLGTTGTCRHRPARYFGSPNGVFPMRDGRYLVTEIAGDWVDALRLSGSVAWSTHPPGVAYLSDTNEISADRYLTVDYSTPGQIVVFNRKGEALWTYRPTGAPRLSKPSLALPLPGGDIIATDDANHRLIVVDSRTKRVVWQYGHKGVPGTSPGYLANPDGMDLLPPHALWPLKAQ